MLTFNKIDSGSFVFLILLAACSGGRQVTVGDFHKIKPGMTYDQVVKITKHAGKKLGRNEEIDGVELPRNGATVYYWQNSDGSNLSVSFIDGREVSAAEWAL